MIFGLPKELWIGIGVIGVGILAAAISLWFEDEDE
jgi:hypothetical protein